MKNRKVPDINFSDKCKNTKSKIAYTGIITLNALNERKSVKKKYLKNLPNHREQIISIGRVMFVEFLNYLERIETRRYDLETGSPIIGEVVHVEFNVNSWFGSVWEGFLGDDRDRRNDVSLNKFVAWEQRVGKTRSVYL